ncbi:tetratricopeptide repeat protein [Plantibacter sp. CFBP 8775]|uniref:tetratricopeptide repeat protein n=1 Tax=Plantibacter sp. CFBP 8775 TaxID=2774038 RepID=UPI001785B243|nr:tetratricopeptide repeat protein [Plantibacter sp. CFBP 8775]MBD8102285.1 tetratricopeptide repeat protein [Plantibacter sp. CFBP 8775]
MTEWDPELPDDWRDLENGHELVVGALMRAYKRRDDEHIAELVDVAGELAGYGAFIAANALASIGVSYVLGVPLESVLDEYQSETTGSERARLIRAEAPATEVTSRVLAITAFIARREGRTDDALALYRDAAHAADEVGDSLGAAQLLQSIGALHHETGDTSEARKATTEALERYEQLGDIVGTVGTELNLVEYAAVEDRTDEARQRLQRLEKRAHDAGDPHLAGSWLARSAVMDMFDGDAQGGRTKLRRVLKNAERRGDTQLQIAALGHLAQSQRDGGHQLRALAYAERALAAAEESGDPVLFVDTAHELAIDYAKIEDFDRAVPLLRRAVEKAVGVHRSQALADLGAVLVSQALDARVSESTSPDAEESGLAEAEDVLLGAVKDLIRNGDEEWASRGLRNLRIVWLASGHSEEGARHLRNFAVNGGGVSSSFAGECFRLSGLLMMDAGADSSEALDLLRSAARLLGAVDSPRASLLLDFARVAEHSYRALDVALALYDDALDELSPSDQPTVFGNALNDSALVLMKLDDDERALERLQAASEIAQDRSDRVLGALVEMNVGEIYSRAHRPHDARPHFERAAAQAEAFGDDERAALALASLANTFVNDDDASDYETARSVARRAEELAKRSGDENARSRAAGALASLAFADGDLDDAYLLWEQARQIAAPNRRPIYEGFMLHALASRRDGVVFGRQLERFARAAQKNHTELLFAEQLWPSANVWLRHGDVRRSAKVLAYSILLASAGHSATKRDHRVLFDNQVAASTEANIAVMRVLAYAGNMLTMEVIPADLRDRLHPTLLKALTTHGVADDEAATMVAYIEEFAREDE